MNAISGLVNGWLLHSAVGGGFLLLLVWLVMRFLRQPARQQRLGEAGLVAALLLAGLVLAPSWLYVPLLDGMPGKQIVTPAIDSAALQASESTPGGEESAMP